MSTNHPRNTGLTRRDFVKRTATGLAGIGAGLLASGNYAYAGGSERIRVGVVGCGGRGTGAAHNALTADPAVEIHAMGDLFRDRLESSRQTLIERAGDRAKVPDERCFDGFDCYRKVMDSGIDVVLLTTPPGLRPMQLHAAVERGLHVFMEKPVAVDSAGIRAVIEAGKAGKRKNLTMVAGTQYRRQPSFVEAIEHIHNGEIGDLVGAQGYYMTGPIWVRERQPDMTDMEWQSLNWYYFTWLSGDHIVEQFIHNLDTLDWVFRSHPESAIATGGRQVRTGPEYGHIYDHFNVEYRYPGGARVQATCRQMRGTANRNANRIVGTKGVAMVNPRNAHIISHDGETLFRRPDAGNNPYVQTHVDLVAAVRNGEPINETEEVAESTLTAILGREAAYTGQELTREQVRDADMDLLPPKLEPGPLPEFEVPRPGVTPLERNFPV
jgi:myo-inositol 2-dehydrogenase / D-chiro-inositol 1-dehydrogenase